jgi:hypothetical protein
MVSGARRAGDSRPPARLICTGMINPEDFANRKDLDLLREAGKTVYR